LKAIENEPGVPFTREHFEWWCSNVVLDTGEPWIAEKFQLDFAEDLFAGIPECWLLIAEGNAKTTLFSGIGLYHIQHHPQGRVPVAASAKEQAMELFLQADGMILANDWMQQVFISQEGVKRIKCPSQGSRLQVFAADDRTGDGVIFTLALLDELHRHKDLRLYRTWTGKRKKRGGQIAAISTAGEPGSEFEQTRDKIRQQATERTTRPGFIRAKTNTVVLHEYAIPEKSDPENMKNVKLANPLSTISIADLKEKRESLTMTLEHWLRFTCNVATRSAHAAISEKEWFDAASEDDIPAGKPVGVGLDIAWKIDTTAAVPLYMPDLEHRLLGEAHVIEPPRDGTMIHPDEIKAAILKINERNPIAMVVMDMSKAEDIAAWISDELDLIVVDRGQGNPMHVLDYQNFTKGLRSGSLKHVAECPALTSHVLNAVTRELPGGDVRFVRPVETRGGSQAQQKRRVIDALTAAGMINTAMEAELTKPPPPKKPEPQIAVV
jgi:phage terminase large subunit-like protein